MKWSDGKPYTTDDILFWWNDVVKSKHHAKPYTVAGMNVATDKVVKVDATTVRFEFAEPRPNFLIASRGAWSYGFYGYPAHYFKQYHPDYNGTAADKAQEVFQKLLDRLYQNSWVSKDVNAPTVNAWKVVDFKEGQYALFDRNPYFYGVDPENNQLPYIDQIEGMDKYDKDAETMKLKMLAGEADMLFRVVRPVDYPVFKEKEKQLGIQLVLLNDSFNGRQIFFFNQNSPTKNVVDLLRNADFRRAWSLALNRNLMNESIFLGLGKLGHGFSDAGVFDPKIDGAYATLDVAKANALLDALKLDKRDSEKFRLLPDGSPLTINLMFQSNWGIGADQVVQIAVDNLREIGLRVSAKPAERKVYQDTVNSDDWQVRLGPSTGGWFGYWGIGMIVSQFARQEWLWMTSAKEAKRQGVEPQGKLKEASDLYWNIQQSTDKAQQDKLRAQYRELMADQLWEVGSVAVVPGILIINASLKNVPGQVQRATIQQGESEYLRFEQWYLDK